MASSNFVEGAPALHSPVTLIRSGNEARAVKGIRENIEGWRRRQASGAKEGNVNGSR